MPGLTLPALKSSYRSLVSYADEVSCILISDDDSSGLDTDYDTDDATSVSGDEVNGMATSGSDAILFTETVMLINKRHANFVKHKRNVDDNSLENKDIAESDNSAVYNEIDSGGNDLDGDDNDIHAGYSRMDTSVSDTDASDNNIDAENSEMELDFNDIEASDSEMELDFNDIKASDNEMESKDNNTDAVNSEMEFDVNDIEARDSEMETGDGKIASGGKDQFPTATPSGDDSVEDWAEYRAASNLGAEETQAVDQQEGIDDNFYAITSGTTGNSANSNGKPGINHKRTTTAIKWIRHWLDKLEAELSPVVLESPAPKGKRKRTTLMPPAKRRKCPGQVNITATRVRVQYEGTSEVWEYTWQRSSAGGRCWVGHRGGEREEVDGECLLVHGPNILIDVVVDATWLPIAVGWDMEKGVFQGKEY